MGRPGAMTGTGWGEIGNRLDQLAELCGEVRFWLRDDDATEPSAALDRLLGIAAETATPLALAVVPAVATAGLADRLAGESHITVLQHGISHANHAPPGEKKAELGDHRPVDAVLADLAHGRDRLHAFSRVAPILAPPWNRIGVEVAKGLAGLGYRGLSLFTGRKPNPVAPGVLAVDTHLDPVDWAAGSFKGEREMLRLLAERLDTLIDGRADPRRATGILTHHLVHDGETFTFLSGLLRYLAKRKDCRFLSADDLLAKHQSDL
ncbi:polysaccharide deacetylase family protein [Aureimonas leprariae]|uniref:Polysaccharide deacetylase n=1 Tax=Plantimonas leprariae TaxID=2615207 RepID=A0A7V7PM59_9HYPH|nr:polysaccharide deacetylase family protein [Aureimonas leprariae]KAB0677759.1 polysaccharide deacetylase [Aureimonas leprariae]